MLPNNRYNTDVTLCPYLLPSMRCNENEILIQIASFPYNQHTFGAPLILVKPLKLHQAV